MQNSKMQQNLPHKNGKKVDQQKSPEIPKILKEHQEPAKVKKKALIPSAAQEPPNVYGLTWNDLKYNFWAVKVLTLIKIMHTELHVKSGRMKRTEPETPISKLLFGFWKIFLPLRIILLGVDIIWANFFAQVDHEPTDLEIHRNIFTIFWLFYIMALYTGYIQEMIQKRLVGTTIIWNFLIQKIKAASQQKSETANLKSVGQRPARVMLWIYLPVILYPLVVALMNFAIIDPEISILLSSYAVKFDLSPLFYGALTLLDLFANFAFVSLVYAAVLLMLFCIIKFGEDVQLAVNELRRTGDLEAAVTTLRTMNVMFLFFNTTYSILVYFAKLICINAAILGGAGFIKLIHTNAIFSMVYLLIFIQGFVIYSILFGKIYKITAKAEELKARILARAKRSKLEKKYCQKLCRSVPRLGIKVSEFYLLERENIMLFGDFVVTHIVNLLIAF